MGEYVDEDKTIFESVALLHNDSFGRSEGAPEIRTVC